jgi:phosphoglycolate phosphatase
MQLNVIIFDCDGVLFDSRRANQFFYNHLLRQFGRGPLTETGLDYVHMHAVTESIEFLFPEPTTRDQVHLYRQSLDYTPFIGMMDMEPGLVDFLEFIRPWAKTAVSTNRTNTINQVLKTFALDSYFDLVISAQDVERPKPDPESLYRILAHFRISPEQGLFIGDSEVDAQTALRAGVPFVAYKNEGLFADFRVQGFAELTEVLKRTGGLKKGFKGPRGQGFKRKARK